MPCSRFGTQIITWSMRVSTLAPQFRVGVCYTPPCARATDRRNEWQTTSSSRRRKGRDSHPESPGAAQRDEPTAQRRAAAAVERMNADDDVGCLGWRGEILGLEWRNVDFRAGEVRLDPVATSVACSTTTVGPSSTSVARGRRRVKRPEFAVVSCTTFGAQRGAAFVPEHRDGRGPFCVRYLRSDLKPARTSSERSCGCSHAAKWPPLGSLL